MILYNITVIIDEAISDQWLKWVRLDHLPAMMATDLFESYRLLRVVDSPNEGTTYCVQLIIKDEATYQDYIANFEPTFREAQTEKFGNSLVLFPSTMEFIAYQ